MSVIEALAKLTEYATELDTLSKSLTEIERLIEPVDEQVTRFCDDYEIGLYTRSTEEDGYKLPSESLRVKLARRALPPELYGKHVALHASRDRLERRIRDLKLLVDAQRSLVSAYKLELEASSGGQPAWSRA